MGRSACPSGRPRAGSLLLGMRGPDGTITYLRSPIEIGAEFETAARPQNEIEERFRFTEPCAGNGCGHWRAERCGLIDDVVEVSAPTTEQHLPRCGIRASCVWFAQHGPSACAACQHVTRSLASHDGPYNGHVAEEERNVQQRCGSDRRR